MTDQLSAKDWLDQGLKTLAKSGFTALKAEPLAKAMGVSRGSFYWHFADIAAYHAAILKYWREVSAEQIIASLEASAGDDDPLALLLRRTSATSRHWRRRSAPGQRSTQSPRGRAGHRSPSAGLWKACSGDQLADEAARARAKFSIGRFGFAPSDQPPPTGHRRKRRTGPVARGRRRANVSGHAKGSERPSRRPP
jgi:AcrR family transcriptional regulator